MSPRKRKQRRVVEPELRRFYIKMHHKDGPDDCDIVCAVVHAETALEALQQEVRFLDEHCPAISVYELGTDQYWPRDESDGYVATMYLTSKRPGLPWWKRLCFWRKR